MAVRVAFLGNDRRSTASLDALAEAEAVDVVLVVTREPVPSRRGRGSSATVVADLAHRRGLPLAEAASVRSGSGLERLKGSGPDVLCVVSYGEILTPEVLAVPRLGAVNVHYSLLPRWRGAAPVQRALMAGDEVTGVTTMLMDAGLDTGPILLQREEPIRADDDAGSLWQRLDGLGAELLVETVRRLESDDLRGTPQDTAAATLAPKIRTEERRIDWTEPAAGIVRRVRALAPEPGATTIADGSELKVLRAEPWVGGDGPGEVVDLVEGDPIVAAGGDAVRLRELVPAGRRRMSAAEWARGARVRPGDRLG